MKRILETSTPAAVPPPRFRLGVRCRSVACYNLPALACLPGGAMSDTRLGDLLRTQLDDLRNRGLYKRERLLQSPQGAAIRVADRAVINFCANNYLGLANHPAVVEAAH